jgi:hypothetical protein
LGLPGENLASQHPRVIFLPSLKELIDDLHSRNECPCKEPHHARPRGHQSQPEGSAVMSSTVAQMAEEIARLRKKAGE